MARVHVTVRLDKSRVRIDDLLRDLSPSFIGVVMKESCEAVLVPTMRKVIKQNKSIYLKNLYNGISARRMYNGQGEASVGVGGWGVPHALNVEKGSPPHTPDYNKLLDWVRRKLKPKGSAGKVASHISRSIEKTGVAPRPYMHVSLDMSANRLSNDMIRRLKSHLRT